MSDILIIFAARWLLYISLGVLPYLWVRGKRRDLVWILISMVAALAFAEGLDSLFHVPRPFVAGGFEPLVAVPVSEYYASFPSGHATIMAALGMAAFFSDKVVGITIALLAVITGVARVAAGVHYPIDIVAGLFLGIVVSILIKFACDRLLLKRH